MADKSDYTQEMLEKAKEYLFKWEEKKQSIPSVEGLAFHLGKARSTINKWRNEEDKKEFSDIVEHILAMQSIILMNKGLTGEFNSSITKLMLSKHGYIEKQETDLTSKGEALQPVLVKFIDDDRDTE